MAEEKQCANNYRRDKMKPAYDALISCYPFTLDDLEDEQWRDISDKYQVSTYGRMKSFWRKVPLILKPKLSQNGYLEINLHIDGQSKYFRVHRLVAQAFIPNPENKPEVNHDDGHPMNCFVGNLWWATSSENTQHAVDTGLLTNAKGVDDSQAKFKIEDDIIYIRNNPDKLSGRELAKKFGVKEKTISDIQLGESYQNVGGSIRQSQRQFVSEEKRAQILADYQPGVRGHGYEALAKKYELGVTKITNIIKGKS